MALTSVQILATIECLVLQMKCFKAYDAPDECVSALLESGNVCHFSIFRPESNLELRSTSELY